MKKKSWLLMIGALALLLVVTTGVGWKIYMATRGIRNHNPGNIRETQDDWIGLANPRTDGEYFIFTEPKYGIRALAKVLLNYEKLYQLHTIREIINRWAPPTENLTDSYIDHVSQRLATDPDEIIEVADELAGLVEAIIIHENGVNPYDEELIAEGIGLV